MIDVSTQMLYVDVGVVVAIIFLCASCHWCWHSYQFGANKAMVFECAGYQKCIKIFASCVNTICCCFGVVRLFHKLLLLLWSTLNDGQCHWRIDTHAFHVSLYLHGAVHIFLAQINLLLFVPHSRWLAFMLSILFNALIFFPHVWCTCMSSYRGKARARSCCSFLSSFYFSIYIHNYII